MNKENLTAYEVVTEENLTDIHSTGWLLRHKKTGARVMLIENDDENKVFNIGFRTPPKDSTGVAHIVEHTVLCGSDKFPVKDPFIELAKGSLNTLFSSSFSKTATLAPLFLWRSKYPVLFKSNILLSSINSYALQFETFIATLQSILFFLFSIFFQIFIQYHIWRGNVKNLSVFSLSKFP